MSPFAALEQRVNRAGIERLANASALWWPGGRAAGEPVGDIRVVFDREGGPGLDGMVNTFNPVLSALEASMQGVKRGDVVEITPDGAPITSAFEVARQVADGTGLLVCQLVAEGEL